MAVTDVTIPDLTPVAGADTAAIPDDVVIPVNQVSASPSGLSISTSRLRQGAATLLNKILGSGCVVGQPGTMIPAYVTQIRVGSGNQDLSFLAHASAAWDAASIAAGAAATTTVAITGAATTDMALARARADHDGLILTARVTSSGTVTLRLFNVTSGAIDPPSITFDVLVVRMS